jgi:hypothetical protein
LCNAAGWASPDQIVNRVDLKQTLKGLHLSMGAPLEMAHTYAREVAATHPRLTAPARVIAMRAQGAADIARGRAARIQRHDLGEFTPDRYPR